MTFFLWGGRVRELRSKYMNMGKCGKCTFCNWFCVYISLKQLYMCIYIHMPIIVLHTCMYIYTVYRKHQVMRRPCLWILTSIFQIFSCAKMPLMKETPAPLPNRRWKRPRKRWGSLSCRSENAIQIFSSAQENLLKVGHISGGGGPLDIGNIYTCISMKDMALYNIFHN